MIGLDSNILLRFLVQDDPEQTRRASNLIERRLTEDNPGFVTVVAMAEIAWVLERSYRFTNSQIAAAIERILQIDVLIVQDEKQVFTALVALKERQASFADALIAGLGAKAGCSRTFTFDRKALRIPDFELA